MSAAHPDRALVHLACVVLDEHASAWGPILVPMFGAASAAAICFAARQRHPEIVGALPDLGGVGNPLIRHLLASTTSLALYEAMRACGHTPVQAGHTLYEAVSRRVSMMPQEPPPTARDLALRRVEAARSQQRRFAGDYVWAFVEGAQSSDGEPLEYGYDFVQCPTHRLYLARGAGEFLPYCCYLDFVTYRTAGWGFSRSTTLGEGGAVCYFRFRRGGATQRGWPPPFARTANAT